MEELSDEEKAVLDDAVRRYGREGAMEWLRRIELYMRFGPEALKGLPPLEVVNPDPDG